MMRPRLALCLLLAAAGCHELRAQEPWPALQVNLQELAERYPHDPAVVLRREDRYSYSPGSDDHWLAERFEAIAILTEAGERYAEIEIPLGPSRLSYLRARTILPDGSTQDVKPDEVHEVAAYAPGGWSHDARRTAKVFRLPNVRPGTVIEYAYGYGDRYFHYALRGVISGPLPIRHYHLEISDAGPYAISGKLYNIDGKINSDGGHATFDIDDLPAQQKEPYSLPERHTEPGWVVVVTAANRMPLFATWNDALAKMAYDLYLGHGWMFDGVSTKPSLGTCARGSLCAVERALAWVQDETELTAFGFTLPGLNELSKALAAHQANSTHKALLLHYALDALGVRARFALVARELENAMDASFPNPFAGDHLLLVLDVGDGERERLFLDPSCEWCHEGQIPPWLRGKQALVFAPKIDAPNHIVAETEWLPVTGDVTSMSSDRRSIEARLDATGALDGSIQRELGGPTALAFHLDSRTWLDDRWQQELDQLVHQRSAAAQPRGGGPGVWDKTRGRLRYSAEYRVPGYAAVDGARLVVPLSLLHGRCDAEPSRQPRRHDVYIGGDERDEETLILHLPSGYRVAQLPAKVVASSAPVDGALDVQVVGPETIRVRRLVQLHAGHWPPAAYAELTEVMRKLAAARQQLIVLEPRGAAPSGGGGKVTDDK